jgi:hypothetical protein
MKPGDLVTPVAGGIHMYDTIQPHLGIFISTLCEDHLGVAIDSGYSAIDVPYVRILNAEGKIGWVRYERVKVISEAR